MLTTLKALGLLILPAVGSLVLYFMAVFWRDIYMAVDMEVGAATVLGFLVSVAGFLLCACLYSYYYCFQRSEEDD